MASCPATGSRSKARGFGLVEIMIAGAIGLMVLAALIPVLLAHRIIFAEAQRFGELQESMAFAVDYLSRDLRGASSVSWSNNSLRVRR